MLQAIRERAQGWIAWAIVVLISVPFALWGIQEYLGVGGEPMVAKVGGREIAQRELDDNFQRYRMVLRERLGAAYDASLLDDAKLREQVLESMIRSEVILQAAVDKGMRAGADLIRQTIAGMPSFQSDGRFDRVSYESNLRRQGLTPGLFEPQVRASILSQHLSAGIQDSAFLTPRDLREIRRLHAQKRGLSYLVLAAEDFRPAEPPSDADVAAYYQAHPGEFLAPEQVKLAYVELDGKRLPGAGEVSEEELKAYFDRHRDELITPEQRRARHILVPVAEGASPEADAAARAQAVDVQTRLKAGESFETLAKELSGDPGSAAQGGDLGWFERGVMEPAFESAVFSMTPGQVSEPVRTPFGLHIIELVDVRSAAAADFDSVRDRVAAAVHAANAERLFYDYSERLANLSYEHPDSLEPAAQALGLKVQHSDWIGRAGGPGPLAHPKVAAAAFGEDVLVQRYNSEPIELGPEHILVLRVVDHQEERARPLEAVREQIAEDLRQQRGAERARAAAEELLARLRGGAALDAEAAALGRALSQPGAVGRDAMEVPPAILAEAFRLPKPQPGTLSYGQALLGGGDIALIAVSEVREAGAEAGAAPEQEAFVGAAQRARGDGAFAAYVDYLKSRTEVTITATRP